MEKLDSDDLKSNKKLIKLGIFLTAVYFSILIYYIFSANIQFDKIKPEDFGSFLSGVFSPLAFLWVVLGFIQQGIELRQSSRALYVQSEELRHSVEQQKELVLVTNAQLNFQKLTAIQDDNEKNRSAQPILRLTFGGSSHSGGLSEIRFYLNNFGAACSDVKLDLHHDFSVLASSKYVAFLDHQGKIEIILKYTNSQEISDNILRVKLKNKLGVNLDERFNLIKVETGGRSSLKIIDQNFD